MSKLMKEMIIEQYRAKFDGIDDAVLVDIRTLDANQNNEMRTELGAKDIRVTVVQNRLAKVAFADSNLKAIDTFLAGPTAVVYGADSVVNVAREIMDWSRKIKSLELKGAVLDGEIFDGKSGVEALSKFPTKEESHAQVVQLVLTPGSDLVNAATAPGAQLLGIVDEMIDRLEKGETIDKVS